MAGVGSDNRSGDIRIVVAGDAGTGKTSLVFAASTGHFVPNVPSVLPPAKLPEDMFPTRVPVTVIDTSSRTENRTTLVEELKRADAIVLTYSCDRPPTLDSLTSFWLPELRRLEVTAPVIVAGCRQDTQEEEDPTNLEQVMSPIMQQFPEIETCIQCSAFRVTQVVEVFYFAQKAVLYPAAPLADQEAGTLKPRCIRALKRIFILCDHDRDDALSDVELNDFQIKCFQAPLQPSEISEVKKVVQQQYPGGINDRGLTLAGFLFLQALFIEKGRTETTWTVLRRFGYNNDIRLADDRLPPPFRRHPDQSAELRDDALDFLRKIFFKFDIDGDGSLRTAEVEGLFSTAPANPWNEAPYRDAAEKNVLGGLTLDGFLSTWALMALLDPIRCFEYLIYIGYAGDVSSAIRITRRRLLDRKKQQSDRNVYQCFVFGPKEAGKSTILDSFPGRPSPKEYVPTTTDNHYVVHIVDQPGDTKKALVLREIPEDNAEKFLSSKDALAACDVAIFVYDRSCESSWKRATELLLSVASQGEATGYEVPCLIAAAKDDLDPYPTEIQDSTRVSQDLGIEAPIRISGKLRDVNIFCRIVSVAQHPHLSIPETEAGKSRKQYRQFISRSLKFASVGAAIAFVGLGGVLPLLLSRNVAYDDLKISNWPQKKEKKRKFDVFASLKDIYNGK
ncbi:OLC1v1000474C1 [Oldenlandia corymbosa var. corymbosa]|uniref:Mitochondrial Rho GTPase n=1 Tax=Oldenlandia corymbosa var. corymbosa TaxID=529605 RepID=A0AAV1D2Z7_OLDCO|nr:OLC1v1000474C1 [Oldenlandia corymbosa var. corymbosa]